MAGILIGKIGYDPLGKYFYVPVRLEFLECYPELLEDEIEIQIERCWSEKDKIEIYELKGKIFNTKIVEEITWGEIILPMDIIRVIREYGLPERFYVILRLIRGIRSNILIFPRRDVKL